MSKKILRNGNINFSSSAGDVRIIRPFVYVRERDIRKWALESKLPVISENCPACFEIPKERRRMKTLLSTQEHLYVNLFPNLMSAMKPLMEGKLQSSSNEKDDLKDSTT
jgi:tRNA(Ile)-lysidine synthase TilS/MesJ